MARQLRLEYEGAIYHITARRNERKKIYHSQRDYTKFKEYLKLSKKRFGCIVHAHVLMGNHYHRILETPEGNLSKVMHFLKGSTRKGSARDIFGRGGSSRFLLTGIVISWN